MDSFDAVEDRFVIRVESLVDILSFSLEAGLDGEGRRCGSALLADMMFILCCDT
jgi:hypothetical protein